MTDGTLTDDQVTALLASVIVSLTEWSHWTENLKEAYAVESAKKIMHTVTGGTTVTANG